MARPRSLPTGRRPQRGFARSRRRLSRHNRSRSISTCGRSSRSPPRSQRSWSARTSRWSARASRSARSSNAREEGSPFGAGPFLFPQRWKGRDPVAKIKYVGKKDRKEDNVAPTDTVWNGPGDVQEVDDPVAVEKLLDNPNIW